MRQLKQRVALRCTLSPLGVDEASAYIDTRIRVAGGECIDPPFDGCFGGDFIPANVELADIPRSLYQYLRDRRRLLWKCVGIVDRYAARRHVHCRHAGLVCVA